MGLAGHNLRRKKAKAKLLAEQNARAAKAEAMEKTEPEIPGWDDEPGPSADDNQTEASQNTFESAPEDKEKVTGLKKRRTASKPKK